MAKGGNKSPKMRNWLAVHAHNRKGGVHRRPSRHDLLAELAEEEIKEHDVRISSKKNLAED